MNVRKVFFQKRRFRHIIQNKLPVFFHVIFAHMFFLEESATLSHERFDAILDRLHRSFIFRKEKHMSATLHLSFPFLHFRHIALAGAVIFLLVRAEGAEARSNKVSLHIGANVQLIHVTGKAQTSIIVDTRGYSHAPAHRYRSSGCGAVSVYKHVHPVRIVPQRRGVKGNVPRYRNDRRSYIQPRSVKRAAPSAPECRRDHVRRRGSARIR